MDGVHAMTDVTGFGLAGHALEMARGAQVRRAARLAKAPLLEGVARAGARGFVTGASGRNWAGYGAEVLLASRSSERVERELVSDPQTWGGLLVGCAPESVKEVIAVFRGQGFDAAAPIGVVREGVGLRVVP